MPHDEASAPSSPGSHPEEAASAPSRGAEPADAPPSAPAAEPAAAPSPRVPASAAIGRAHASYLFLALVTVVSLGADLWSKHWAKTHFESLRPGAEKRLVVVEDIIAFIFAKNRGGAWGLLQNENEALRRPFFLIVSVAAIVFIVSLYRKLQPGQTALKWGLPLVLGGALGNLVDRIRYGYVVDFIDVYMKVDGEVKHWPTFNVADIAICVGVALMAIDMFTSRKEHKHPAVPAVEVPESVTLASRVDDGPPPRPGAEPTPPTDAEGEGRERPNTAEGT